MQPSKNEFSSAVFVFYDFETTQDTKINESAKLHAPILVFLQHFYTACEMQDEDDERDCARLRYEAAFVLRRPCRRSAIVPMRTAHLV